MRSQPPTIFISATTADLIKAREVVTKALLDLGCHPEVQEHFGTSEGNIAAREAAKIENCDAVIHLVGKIYGAAPAGEASGRSYTQLEHDTAVRLKKPLYIFLATEQFFADPNNLPSTGLPIESADRVQKQREHYLKLRAGDNIWFEFSSLAELRDKIMQLREKDKKWGKVLKTDRRHYLWIAAATFLLLAAIAAGLFVQYRANKISRKHDKEEQRRMNDETREFFAQEMEKTRQMLVDVDLAAKNSKEQPPNLKGQELLEWTLKRVAEAERISTDEARARMARFVAQVETDKSASPRDRELANIARKFVVKGFSPAEFEQYVKSLTFGEWRPNFFVLHHTSFPSLAQRPDGFTDTFLRNMVTFYTEERRWSGGPHLFVDRHRIWVFNTLTEPGIHASAWNKESIGVSLQGDYEVELLDDKVRDNAVSAIATLCQALHIDGTQVRLHSEAPRGTGGTGLCPGKNLSKEGFIELVTKTLSTRKDS